MSQDHPGERLSQRRHVTFLLRLVLGANGTLVHGEITDLDARVRGRFASWEALRRIVEESRGS